MIDVLLPDKLLERARAHAVSQRRFLFELILASAFKEIHHGSPPCTAVTTVTTVKAVTAAKSKEQKAKSLRRKQQTIRELRLATGDIMLPWVRGRAGAHGQARRGRDIQAGRRACRSCHSTPWPAPLAYQTRLAKIQSRRRAPIPEAWRQYSRSARSNPIQYSS